MSERGLLTGVVAGSGVVLEDKLGSGWISDVTAVTEDGEISSGRTVGETVSVVVVDVDRVRESVRRTVVESLVSS